MAQVEIRDNQDAGRFEAVQDGEVVAYTEYSLSDGVMTMPHTVTDPEHRGQGLAAQVVEAALTAAADAGLTVRPTCSYVRDHIAEHPEFERLLEGH